MEIGQVVIEIRGIENGELAVSVNNTLTLICHTTFLATDTRPCVIRTCSYISSVINTITILSYPAAKLMHFIVYMYLLSTRVVGQSSTSSRGTSLVCSFCSLAIMNMPKLHTTVHVHTKLSFTCGKHADTRIYRSLCSKFKLSCTVYKHCH